MCCGCMFTSHGWLAQTESHFCPLLSIIITKYNYYFLLLILKYIRVENYYFLLCVLKIIIQLLVQHGHNFIIIMYIHIYLRTYIHTCTLYIIYTDVPLALRGAVVYLSHTYPSISHTDLKSTYIVYVQGI